MTRAVVSSFHNYCPMYDHRYFNVLSNYFFNNFKKVWGSEIDKLYILDSNWEIETDDPKIAVIKTNPNLRYYEAYKEVLPEIKEDLVLFVDNDMAIYRPGVVKKTFDLLDKYDVVSIYDTIGERRYEELGGQSKFCLYWLAASKELLKKYLDIDWGQAPWGETLSYLTEAMLKDKVKPYEWEEDKTSIYFDGHKDGERGKDLGYYHIRAGSVPAYLLTHRNFGNKETYLDYIKSQPRREYLRQMAWFFVMGYTTGNADAMNDLVGAIQDDLGIQGWDEYIKKFAEYHGL